MSACGARWSRDGRAEKEWEKRERGRGKRRGRQKEEEEGRGLVFIFWFGDVLGLGQTQMSVFFWGFGF